MPLLSVEHLTTAIDADGGTFFPVHDLSFSLNPGETLGIVGESGCGKTFTALSLMRLIPSPPARIASGRVLFSHNGGPNVDLLSLPEREMRRVRGKRLAMIFQEPMTSLNPLYAIGNQIEEAIELHEGGTREGVRNRAVEMLELVGIPAPAKRRNAYPHELSGGMRQRAMIAMALSCRPDILIADEPTTALDVTIQAQILALISELQKKLGMALILITHDLGVVAEVTDRVMVMYAGRCVEEGPTAEVFARPLHPYTQGLIQSVPPLEMSPRMGKLSTIGGMVPQLAHLPPGCSFQDRCPKVQPRCREGEVPDDPCKIGRIVRCWYGKL